MRIDSHPGTPTLDPVSLHPYRIVYSVGRLEFTWIRSGESKVRVTELARRALKDAHHGHAVLVTVERLEA